MPSLFLLPKHELYYEWAGSIFSEQIFYLSFPEFSIGVAKSNRYVHASPSVRNIKSSAVNLRSCRHLHPGISFHGYQITPHPCGQSLTMFRNETSKVGMHSGIVPQVMLWLLLRT